MKKQFTEQEVADAKFYTVTAVKIRNRVRIMERLTNLRPDEVLGRVTDADRERYLRGKALYHAGAGQE